MKPCLERAALMLLVLLVLACGEAESLRVLDFDTQPSCAAADATCINAGTSTLTVQGMRVIHKPLPGHPLVSFQLSFDAPNGSSRQRWAETLALSMYTLGGPRRFINASDWDAELVRLGGSVGAGNGLDYGSISATAPVFNWRELWDLVIEGIADYRNYPWELDNRRGIFERGFSSERDDPNAAASIDAWSRLFEGQAYNYQREYQETLAAVSRVDIDDAWGALSASERWLVGDVSADEVAAAVEDARPALAQVGTSPRFAPDPVRELPLSPHVRVLPYPDAPTWYVVADFKGPSGSSPDFAPLGLGLSVLDRRLFEEVRDVRGLAYTTGAGLSFYREAFGSVWLTSESPREALSVARRVLFDLKATGPTEAELAAARSAFITRLLTSNDTPSGMAATLADWELTAGAREALDDQLVAVEEATPAGVASMLEAYLRDIEIAAAGGGSELGEQDLESWFVAP
jgi:zinc protease